VRIRRLFDFEAAHALPRHPGKCRDLHGHSYRFAVVVRGKVNPDTGLAIDFDDLETVVRREVISALDHKNLNDTLENPTAEHIAVWIWDRLTGSLQGLEEIELFETRDCSVVYRGD